MGGERAVTERVEEREGGGKARVGYGVGNITRKGCEGGGEGTGGEGASRVSDGRRELCERNPWARFRRFVFRLQKFKFPQDMA